MNPENEQDADAGEMRAEYDIRGGVRGKYFRDYHRQTKVTLEESSFVMTSNAGSAMDRDENVWFAAWYSSPAQPSPEVQVGKPDRAAA